MGFSSVLCSALILFPCWFFVALDYHWYLAGAIHWSPHWSSCPALLLMLCYLSLRLHSLLLEAWGLGAPCLLSFSCCGYVHRRETPTVLLSAQAQVKWQRESYLAWDFLLYLIILHSRHTIICFHCLLHWRARYIRTN